MSLRTDEIQTLVFTGYGSLGGARVLLLRAREGGDARAALAGLPIQFGRPTERVERACQIALSPRGLRGLGLAARAYESFPPSFRLPVEDDHRLRALGDRGANAPATWAWSGDRIDAALLLYATDDATVEALARDVAARVASGYTVGRELATLALDEHKEHFGFRDGLSQPRIRELGGDGDPSQAIAAGELVLGYADETGDLPPSPHDGELDLGRDGSFLVLRQLAQDVAGFWCSLRERCASDDEALLLGAKLMGRWPDGSPADAADTAGPSRSPADPPRYRDDPRGLGIPRGAHVRRANPRDGLLRDPEASLERVRRHRLLRRGRSYGTPAPSEVFPAGLRVTATKAGIAAGAVEDERGLLFACLCADLARQFELVQQAWLNSAKHDGLFDEVCPIAAGRELRADARSYTLPQVPLRRRLRALPHFVTVRGSAYLFLPGRAAWEHLLRR